MSRCSNIYLAIIIYGLLLILASCTHPPEIKELEGDEFMSIELSSNAFTSGGTIPRKYTCDAENYSPELSWSGIPSGTASLALIVDDPDAPIGIWVHWVLFNLPSDISGLKENSQGIGMDGVNDFRRKGYGGPCPPKGSTHRYYFKLYALDTALNLASGATKNDLEKAMQNHILAKGEMIGKYSR